jgi:hypothetical protein
MRLRFTSKYQLARRPRSSLHQKMARDCWRQPASHSAEAPPSPETPARKPVTTRPVMSLRLVAAHPASSLPAFPQQHQPPPRATSGGMKSSTTGSGLLRARRRSASSSTADRATTALTASHRSSRPSRASRSCIIDGEAVACGDDGIALFERIRYRRHDGGVFMCRLRACLSDGPGRDRVEAQDLVVSVRPLRTGPIA